MGKQISKESYFELVNNSNRDIINTSISAVDNYDWDGSYRPDHNLVNRKISRKGGSIRELETVNARANHCPFNMTLEFSDGTKDVIRVHQRYATSDCNDGYVFQHHQKSHEISYRRSDENTLLVTVENTKAQLEDEKAEEENREGEEAMRRKMYEVALRKFENAKNLANERTTINIVDSNLKRAEDANRANKLNEEGKELMKRGHYDSAVGKFDEALEVAESSMVEDINVNKKKALNARAEKLIGEGEDAMRRKLYSRAMEKFDEALVLANERSTIDKITQNKSTVRTMLYRQKQDQDALKVNKEGEDAFSKGEYETAVQKFKQAYGLSNEVPTIDLTKRNLTKATRVYTAKQKNEEGNQLLQEKKYEAALIQFDEALDLAEGSLIAPTINTNKLEALKQYGKALYDEGWLLESEENEDRSVEARESLNKAKDILKKANIEDTLRLVDLKIAGNVIFNEGTSLEQAASSLHESAKRTQVVDDFTMAQKKYEDVLKKYKEAKHKFEEGSSDDRRFVGSVSFVNDQIRVVNDKIAKIEEEKLRGHVRSVSFDAKRKMTENNEITEVKVVNFVSS